MAIYKLGSIQPEFRNGISILRVLAKYIVEKVENSAGMILGDDRCFGKGYEMPKSLTAIGNFGLSRHFSSFCSKMHAMTTPELECLRITSKFLKSTTYPIALYPLKSIEILLDQNS